MSFFCFINIPDISQPAYHCLKPYTLHTDPIHPTQVSISSTFTITLYHNTLLHPMHHTQAPIPCTPHFGPAPYTMQPIYHTQSPIPVSYTLFYTPYTPYPGSDRLHLIRFSTHCIPYPALQNLHTACTICTPHSHCTLHFAPKPYTIHSTPCTPHTRLHILNHCTLQLLPSRNAYVTHTPHLHLASTPLPPTHIPCTPTVSLP